MTCTIKVKPNQDLMKLGPHASFTRSLLNISLYLAKLNVYNVKLNGYNLIYT